MAHTKVLLVEDVDNLGRSGEIVKVALGYALNFLLPKKKAIIADASTQIRQAKLRESRAKQAEFDKKEAQELAKKLATVTLTTSLKVDPEGKPYGSLSSVDMVELLKQKEGIVIEKRHVLQKQPLKAIGMHTIPLRLNEGVEASLRIEISPEGGVVAKEVVQKEKGTSAQAHEE